ncbi:Hpt domain-containing protein [Chitiniphilus purpureus]|uniref:histidine kinase n=1 Tax=Chitiniphilus purpureus TaxID=2981137 RepID=A0ABY6DMZ4_9NEIS|nr:Hpt domain-containing protein [Chitiniphilus sp. CD1]UXY15735.1 Hpt domain-containing protein [Chitiniphilus sp. CD1]
MSAHTEFDQGSLVWLKGELEQTLSRATESLRKYQSEPDAAYLKHAQTHLHQAVGALEMVELAGLARFCEEVEQLVAAIARDQANSDAVTLACSAIADACGFLDRIAAGAPNVPLALAGRFAELAETRGASPSGSELFFPQFSELTLPPGLPARPVASGDWSGFVKQQRRRFEAGLLHWLRNADTEASAAVSMARSLSELAASQTGVVRTFWWTAAGVLDALARSGPHSDIDLKQLLMRLNLQLRRLADGSGKVAERLFRDLLYVLSHVEDNQHLGGHLARAFELYTLLPGHYGDTLSPEAEDRRREARALREELATAKELWSRVAGGQGERLPALTQELARLTERSRALNIAGLDDLWAGVDDAVNRFKGGAVGENDALEMATALLLADNALAIYPTIAPDFAEQATAMRRRLAEPGSTELALPHLDAVSREAQEKLLLAQLAQEMRSNLQVIEETLDGYFRDPGRHAELGKLDVCLRQLQGALMMLDRAEAVLLLQLCQQRIQQYAIGEETPSGKELEDLAEGLSSLGFYVDALEQDGAEADKLIGPALARLAGSSVVPQAPDEVAATLEAEPPLTPEAAEPVPLAEPAPPARPLPQSDAAIDAELLEVYLEEAVDVLAAIDHHLTACRHAPHDREALTVIRRGFHTLKGSGRMVGLNHLGEAAWAVEQVLNKWLQAEHPASGALLDLIAEAHTAFIRWVAELSETGTAQVDAAGLQARAEALRQGLEQAPPAEAYSEAPTLEVDEALPETAADEIRVGDVAVSNTLFTIFRDEAGHHLQRLRDGRARLEAGEALPSDFLLSAHTLGGIASTAGFRPLGELAYALEHAVQELGNHPSEHATPLIAAIERIDGMLEAIFRLNAPDSPQDELAALNALHENALPPVQESATPGALDLGEISLDLGPETVAADDTQDAGALSFDLPEDDLDEALPELAELDGITLTDAAAPANEGEARLLPEEPAQSTGFDDDLAALLDAAMAGEPALADEPQALPELPVAPEQATVPADDAGQADDVAIDPFAPLPEENLAIALDEALAVVQDEAAASQLPGEDEPLTLSLDALPDEPQVEAGGVVPDAAGTTQLATEPVEDEPFTLSLEEAPAVPEFPAALDEAIALVDAQAHGAAPSVTDEAPHAGPQDDADWIRAQDAQVAAALDAAMGIGLVAQEPADILPAPPGRDAVPDETTLPPLHDLLGGDQSLVERRADLDNALVDEIDEQLLPVFIEEADELLPRVGNQLRTLHQGETSQADELKRTLHTLKGSARMSGAMRIGEATHRMESRLLAAGETLSQALLDELEVDYDLISALFDELAGRNQAPQAEQAGSQPQSGQPAAAPVLPQQLLATTESDGKATIRVKSELVDNLVNQAGEVAIARARIESEMLALKTSLLDLTENVTRLRGQLRELEIQSESQIVARTKEVEGKHEAFDPLEFDRFSRLQEITRFIAESVNDVSTIQHNLLKNLDESSLALTAQARMTKELQQSLMRVRMVPFSSVADRLYRLTRQTGKEVGKKVNLELRGGRVEIDRSVLEKMVSPFEHMLRNAIDHGLETVEERLDAGKSDFGEVLIEVRQEGNELVLTIKDDGRGLNLERIRAKALERGLITPEQRLNDRDLMQLIFEPGFSTASSVTQLSGRGIGMDVVKNEIGNLGGRIQVASETGQGTTFTIHLPLTLAVTQVLLVRSGPRVYAIPSVMIEQVQELKQEALAHLYESRSQEWLGSSYPFAYLPRLMGDSETVPEQKRFSTVLLLRSGAARMALHVDDLIKNVEVVVKAIGPQLARIPGVAGATVLGNGDIVLIMNPLALLARGEVAASQGSDAAVTVAPAQLQTAPVVMVVDDSLTVRKITGRLLAREGYQVVTAKDGVDGLQQLGEIHPAVMLVDIEMPRMDGFEFTRNVRANEATRGIPIIMITSRTADKHKNYAFELGVNVFLGKPYQEDELLGHIRSFITARG